MNYPATTQRKIQINIPMFCLRIYHFLFQVKASLLSIHQASTSLPQNTLPFRTENNLGQLCSFRQTYRRQSGTNQLKNQGEQQEEELELRITLGKLPFGHIIIDWRGSRKKTAIRRVCESSPSEPDSTHPLPTHRATTENDTNGKRMMMKMMIEYLFRSDNYDNAISLLLLRPRHCCH